MLQDAYTTPNEAKKGSEPGALLALRTHWPEYLIEAWGLGTFMVSACVFGVLLEHPSSPWRQMIDDPFVRHLIGGLAMGLTAVLLIKSPWGKRSGAHMNPAFTFAFYTLGKLTRWDAVFYIAAQFAGGLAGVVLSSLIIGPPLAHSAVNYVVTVPGPWGIWAAFAGEFVIAFGMMAMVLITSNSIRLARLTPYFAGALLAVYIAWESPISGMSLNPARTLATSIPSDTWTDWWIYFAAPPMGMLFATAAYVASRGAKKVYCAKLDHQNHERCIFRCNYGALNVPE